MPGFWDRLVATIEAKLSKLLERFEDPREQLDYAYDKLAQQVHEVDLALARAITARKKLEFTRDRMRERIQELDEKAKAALKMGREDLARKALERKHVLSVELERIEERIRDMKEDEESLRQAREQLRARLDVLAAKKEQLKAEYEVAKAQVEVREAISGIGEDIASVARIVSRAEERITEMKARAAAIDELVATGGALDVLEPEERDEIEKELERMRIEAGVEEDLKRLREELG